MGSFLDVNPCVLFSELVPALAVRFAKIAVSPFRDHVFVVFSVFPQEHVIGVHAKPNVAPMEHEQAGRNRPAEQFEHEPVGPMLSVADLDDAVAFRVHRAAPQPATCVRFWSNIRHDTICKATHRVRPPVLPAPLPPKRGKRSDDRQRFAR